MAVDSPTNCISGCGGACGTQAAAVAAAAATAGGGEAAGDLWVAAAAVLHRDGLAYLGKNILGYQ